MAFSSRTILDRGVEEVVKKDHLEAMLASGKKLRVKFGIDPTAPDLHLGHLVVLRKLRQFQELGHKIVLIIGDFTAMIGDPSGRSETRKMLTKQEVRGNFKKYAAQAGRILDMKKVEIAYNSTWLGKKLENIIALARAGSIQQVLHRADFKKRLDEGQDITLLEVLYPLFQGYDSVAVKADVELGGTDQKFNLLMGRRVQRFFNEPEQDVVTVPLLEGTDGVKKMSKSYGNYIGLDDKPADMFGKVMSIPDNLIKKYAELLTDLAIDVSNPYEAKLKLAEEITSLCHGAKNGAKAREAFKKVFSRKELPSEMEERHAKKGMALFALLAHTATVSSRGEARRLIEQGGVQINGVKKTNPDEKINLEQPFVLKAGKARFFRIIPE